MTDAADSSDSARPRPTVCQNCGAPLDGPFCARCGQRAIPSHPTVRELVADVWNELVGWDGKVLRTVRLLVLQPGELTRSAIEGRRAQFIGTVRLYLICSVLYFAVSAAVGIPDDATFEFGVSAPGVAESETTPEDAAVEKAFNGGLENLTPDERAAVDAYIAAQSPLLRPMIRGMVEDPRGFLSRVTANLPRALFVLVPVLAAVLGIFYRRRHYPEHLYTAVHLQTFAFLVATLVSLSRLTRSGPVFAATYFGAILVIVGHAVIAQHRVYGESWPKTTLKAVAVALLYGALFLTAFGAAFWAATV